MTSRADQVAADQFAALLTEAASATWGAPPDGGDHLDAGPTTRVFRAQELTAAELRSIALAANTLATAAWTAALSDLATTLHNERWRRR